MTEPAPPDGHISPRIAPVQGGPSTSSLTNGNGANALRSPGSPASTNTSQASQGRNLGRWAQEVTVVVRLAIPLAATNLATFSLSLVNIAFAGSLGPNALATAVLGTTLFNVTGMSIVQGFLAALETCMGQAWGAANYPAFGAVIARGCVLTTLVCVLVTAFWHASTAPILLFMRQDPALAASAARYLTLMAPAIFFQALFEALKRILTVRGTAYPATLVSFATLCVSPLYYYGFVHTLQLGLRGVAFAFVGVSFTMAAALGGYVAVKERQLAAANDPRRVLHVLWTAAGFSGWAPFLKLAGPSVAMICVEWWTFELLVIMAGWLPSPKTSVATVGICLNLSATIWSVVSGLGLACCARVATSLGAGLPAVARRATFSSLAAGLILEVSAAVAVLLAQNQVARAFTEAEEVVTAVALLMPVFALSLPGDGANAVLQGMLRGCGKQGVGALTNLTSYWIVGVPVSYYLAFTRGLGLIGLWGGAVVVNTLQGLIMLVIALRIDFERESVKAVGVQRWAEPLLGEDDNIEY